jgi:hypothetical protein
VIYLIGKDERVNICMLRSEPKLRVLRRIFGCKRKKVAGGWRRLYNEELCHTLQ